MDSNSQPYWQAVLLTHCPVKHHIYIWPSPGLKRYPLLLGFDPGRVQEGTGSVCDVAAVTPAEQPRCLVRIAILMRAEGQEGGLSCSMQWGVQVEERDAGTLQRAGCHALRNEQDLDQHMD